MAIIIAIVVVAFVVGVACGVGGTFAFLAYETMRMDSDRKKRDD